MLLDLALPTLGETLRRVKRAFNAEYQDPRLDAFRPTNLLYPVTTTLGHLLALLHLRVREQASQATPFGATGNNLDAWLQLYGVVVPVAARATGFVRVTGRANALIPAGTELSRIDGRLYRTTEPVQFGPDWQTITVGVEADETGATYNTVAGETLELALLEDSIEPDAIVVRIDGGADPADDAAKQALLRARLAQSRIAGTTTDYELLTRGFSASIDRVFIEPAGLGPGTVVVFPLNRNPQDEQGGAAYWELTVPGAGELAALQAYLARPDIVRVNDRVLVRAVALRPVPITIALTPNTAAVQEAVRDQLRRRFFDAYATGGYVIPASEISGAISAADGELSHTVVDVDGQGPPGATDAVAAFGEILQVGPLTFTEEEP